MANPAAPDGFWGRVYLKGGPDHYRSKLAKDGLTFHLQYLNAYFGVAHGARVVF